MKTETGQSRRRSAGKGAAYSPEVSPSLPVAATEKPASTVAPAPRRTTDTPPSPAEFDNVFAALRGILQRHAGSLSVSEDSARRYCLQGGSHPKHRKPMPIAWVEIGRAYVSFHHMGVYARPQLLQSVSPGLGARMQGKSCFNFKAVDEVLFRELEDLTVRGFAAFRKAGFMP